MRFGHSASAVVAMVLTMLAMGAMLTVGATLMTSTMELLVEWSTRHLKLFIIIIIIFIIVEVTGRWSESLMMLISFFLGIFLVWLLLVVEWLAVWLKLGVFTASLWLLVHWWHLLNWRRLIVELLSHLFNGVSGVLGGIVLLNVVVLLVKVLVNQVVHEVLRVNEGDESDEAHEGSDLAELLLQVLHLLRSSLCHRDALGDTSFGVFVLLQDWFEDFVSRSAHPDGEAAADYLKKGEDKHSVGIDLHHNVLSVNVKVADGVVTAHKNDLNCIAEDIDSAADDENPTKDNEALATFFYARLRWSWVERDFLDGSIASSADHSGLCGGWHRGWSEGDGLWLVRRVLNTLVQGTVEGGVNRSRLNLLNQWVSVQLIWVLNLINKIGRAHV